MLCCKGAPVAAVLHDQTCKAITQSNPLPVSIVSGSGSGPDPCCCAVQDCGHETIDVDWIGVTIALADPDRQSITVFNKSHDATVKLSCGSSPGIGDSIWVAPRMQLTLTREDGAALAWTAIAKYTEIQTGEVEVTATAELDVTRITCGTDVNVGGGGGGIGA